MEEKTAKQNLDLVQEMIDMARNHVTDTGFHFLLWGVLVILASISQYVLIKFGVGSASNFVWIGMTVIGVPIAIIYEKRKDRKAGMLSRFGRIYGLLWLGFGISLFVAIYVSIAFQINPSPFILILVGLATFVSGAFIRFVPLMIGAIVFWAAAALSPLFSSIDFLLVYAVSIFLGYVVPGLMLTKKHKANV